MIRLIFTLFFTFSFFCGSAQVSYQPNYWQLDLERKAEKIRIQDSVRHAQDSLRMLWVKSPLESRPNQFLDSLKEVYTFKDGQLATWKKQLGTSTPNEVRVQEKKHRATWTLAVFGVILLLFSLIKVFYAPQIIGIIHGFYNNTVFIQLNKEENIYNRWPFVLLFILFSFVAGLFFFLGAQTYFSAFIVPSVNVFLLISGLIFGLVLLKVWVTKALGYIFEVSSLSKEYISILYLCYFNGAIYLFPVLLAFLFLPDRSIHILFVFSCLFLILLFLLQFFRASFYTLKAYKFSKFYLFLYFCTLEIGPLLILIKLLGYNLK